VLETTLGIDLASQDKNTAACLLRWGEPVAIQIARADFCDDALAQQIRTAGKVGIDVPLGWPLRFAEALGSYMSGGIWAPPHLEPELHLRATDRYVKADPERGRRPLSVSTDRIAIPAMRAARLLTSADATFDRAGGGTVVEVYPAASLQAWGFDPTGYKRSKGRRIREALVDRFIRSTASWITITEAQKEACTADDNVFDALICALTARAFVLGLCDPIPPEHAAAARLEGWIALPCVGSLPRLAGQQRK
jgi:predicted nuclease with RNAse H fold